MLVSTLSLLRPYTILIATTDSFACKRVLFYTVFQKSDDKIQINITTAYLTRINILLAALIIIFPV